MSILDHSHSYGSTMNYKENPSTRLDGKFFWFSGYYNIGVKPSYNEPDNDETGNNIDVNKISKSEDEIDEEEIDRNINIVSELIAELTENETENETDADEDVIIPSAVSDVSHELINYTYNSHLPINKIPHLEPNCKKVVHNGHEKISENDSKQIPLSTLWFKYNDVPVIQKPTNVNKLERDLLPSTSSYKNADVGNCECPEEAKIPGGVYFQLHKSHMELPISHEPHEDQVEFCGDVNDVSENLKIDKSYDNIGTNQNRIIDNKLMSSIDDLISEVNSNVPSITRTDEKTLPCSSDIFHNEQSNEISDILTLESLERALADIEKEHNILPYMSEHITTENTNNVESKTIPMGINFDNVPSEKCTDNVMVEHFNLKDNIQLQHTKHTSMEEGEIKLEIPPEVTEDITVSEMENTECEGIPTYEHMDHIDASTSNANEECYNNLTSPANIAGGTFFTLSNMTNSVEINNVVPLEVTTGDLKEDTTFAECTEDITSVDPKIITVDNLEDLNSSVPFEECADVINLNNDMDLIHEHVEDTVVHDLNEEAPVQYLKNVELNNEIFPDISEDITMQDINKEISDLTDKKAEHFKDDESYRIGTWFGFAGRTYRAKPMENLLDIDAIDDVPINISTEDNYNVLNCNSTFEEDNSYVLDFRDKNISQISEISEMSEDSLDYKSSFETDLTIVTPLKKTESTGLLKLYEEPLEDEVFVSKKVEEILSCVEAPEMFSFQDESLEEESFYNGKDIKETSPYYNNQIVVETSSYNNLDFQEQICYNGHIAEGSCIDENNQNLEISEPLASEGNNHTFDSVSDDNIRENIEEDIEELTTPHREDVEFINAYLTDSAKKNSDTANNDIDKLHSIKVNDEHFQSKENSPTSEPICNQESFIDTSDDEERTNFDRGTSFRRSIVIEDEVNGNHQRQPSGGATHVSAFYFTPVSPREETEIEIAPENTKCKQAKELLNYLDNILINEETFGRDFEVVKKLHALFWELRDNHNKDNNNNNNPETLWTVLNYMVVQEWPKVFVGVFRKLKMTFPHVFQEHDPEGIVYYSGHMPSILRMNRTSSEFAVAVIFDGLLMSAINFTDVHEASRQASCEDDLVSYLLEEIMPHLNSIHWGKATAKEMFLKSICDLIYNCCQSPSNASYMIDNDLVNVFTMMRDEISEVVDARRVNMTMLLSLSYLIDDNNYDRVVPDEGCILKLLQFLDKSLEHSEHTYFDFYAAELASCLSKIAVHYSNKVLITRNSGQEILHKLLKYAYDDEEKISACEALWNISFSREAKDILREMGKLMNLLRELKKSDIYAVRNAACGIIWECEEKYDIKGTRDTVVQTPQHIMISYEYESQPLVISIRDELKQLGFKVWMTSDGEYNFQDVMTKGVEGASVVIMALTRKYKQEPHSFAEIDYAHTLRKTIVPLIIDMDFMPDGWLNQHIQQEKTFDFSRRSMFNGSLDALVEYLKELSAPKEDSSTINVNITDAEVSKERSTDVLSWSNSDVLDWLKENRLIRTNNTGGRLQKLTGFHLLMFYDLKKETPDYYYSVLDSHLGFKDVLDTLEFTYALDRLLGTERLI